MKPSLPVTATTPDSFRLLLDSSTTYRMVADQGANKPHGQASPTTNAIGDPDRQTRKLGSGNAAGEGRALLPEPRDVE